MKKTILISVGVIVILLIIGIWGYLIVYGKPDGAGDVFTRFGFGGDKPIPAVEVPPVVDVADETTDGTPQRLKQLTVRPVAGAVFTETGILYVAEGTGHIYHIDLTTGEETLKSGTTIPRTHDATFNDGGTYVAIAATEGGEAVTNVGSIDGLTGKLSGVSLPTGAADVFFPHATDTVLYRLPGERGSSGFSYDLEKGVAVEIFNIPLRDVRVLWGDDVFVYTIPTAEQTGYLYAVDGSMLSYIRRGGLSLMALVSKDALLITERTAKGIVSEVQASGATPIVLSQAVIPEKCISHKSKSNSFFCGVPGTITGTFPDDWYMGTVSYSDSLWEVDLVNGEMVLMSDLLGESGREIDISKLGSDASGERLYFINKNDNTLWMFDSRI